MSTWNSASTPYPTARRDDTVETFRSQLRGDVKVPDPYSYLHNPEHSETIDFVKNQSVFTRNHLDLNPNATRFSDELTKNWNYARTSLPALKGDGNFYVTHNSGLDAQAKIFRFKDKSTSIEAAELFFDPNTLSTDGSVSLSTSSFSKNGEYWAYGLSRSGSDWTTISIRKTGKDEEKLADELRFVKFSGISWDVQSNGFFYQRFPERSAHGEAESDAAGLEIDADVNAALYYHRVGTSQSEDTLILSEPNHPERMFWGGFSTDGRYAIMSASQDTSRSNLLWIADLQEGAIGGEMKWNKIVNEWGSYYSEITNDGPLFYFYTNAAGASNYKIVTYNLEKPELGFVDLVSHDSKRLLSSCHVSGDNLILLYSVDVKDEIHHHDLKTGAKISRIAADLIGSVSQISGRREDSDMFFSLTSFSSPGTSYHYDFTKTKDTALELYKSTVVSGLNGDDFITEQRFFESKDGTRIPMFVTRHKDVIFDGTAPVIQYGYGGFNINLDPFFSPSLLTWVKHYRGVLAVVNLRGGGEYGEDWHAAGTKERKQNVFDDFIWATRYLISEKIGAKDKIAINGGSNGGLLVSAVCNQTPELFGAVVGDVGVLDMLRFQRFTIGRAWTSDYGNADQNPVDFDYLFKYSPLHNVPSSDIALPPIMLLTGDHDDRVSPLHTLKLVAELQHIHKNSVNPILCRVDLKAGHGAGKSTQAKIVEATDKYGFIATSLKAVWHD